MRKKITHSFFLVLVTLSLPAFAGSKYHCQIELFPNNEDGFTGGVFRNDSLILDIDEKMKRQSIDLTYYTFIQPKEAGQKLILKKQKKILQDYKIYFGNSKKNGLIFMVRGDHDHPLSIIEATADYNANSIQFQAGTYPSNKNGSLLGYTKLYCSKVEFWKEENIEKIDN